MKKNKEYEDFLKTAIEYREYAKTLPDTVTIDVELTERESKIKKSIEDDEGGGVSKKEFEDLLKNLLKIMRAGE